MSSFRTAVRSHVVNMRNDRLGLSIKIKNLKRGIHFLFLLITSMDSESWVYDVILSKIRVDLTNLRTMERDHTRLVHEIFKLMELIHRY